MSNVRRFSEDESVEEDLRAHESTLQGAIENIAQITDEDVIRESDTAGLQVSLEEARQRHL